MGAFLPDISLVNSLYRLLRPELQLDLRLFTNNVNPVAGSTMQSFTEAAFPGYAPKAIPDLPLPIIDEDGRARCDTPPFTWDVAGIVGQVTIYGWFTTHVIGGGLREVHRVERWPASKTLANVSNPLTFSIYFLAANITG